MIFVITMTLMAMNANKTVSFPRNWESNFVSFALLSSKRDSRLRGNDGVLYGFLKWRTDFNGMRDA